MNVTSRCKLCQEVFLRMMERCPSCGHRTAFGARLLFLKVIALISFAGAILGTVYVLATSLALP